MFTQISFQENLTQCAHTSVGECYFYKSQSFQKKYYGENCTITPQKESCSIFPVREFVRIVAFLIV
jgi:hypothetical protein